MALQVGQTLWFVHRRTGKGEAVKIVKIGRKCATQPAYSTTAS